MAHKATLPGEAVDEIKKQLGGSLPLVFDINRLHSREVKLGASFQVWELSADYDLKPLKPFAKLVTNTGEWHHLIYLDDEAIGFAISGVNEPPKGRLTIQEVYKSEIAAKIDAAMTMVDNLQKDSLTHLLVLQNYLLYAFWLVDIKEVFVISQPEEFKYINSHQLVSEDKFLSDLRQEEPIVGWIPGD